MAQISAVMHALAVFDAARQELAWAYSGDFTDVPEPMKDAVHAISAVLNEAEMRWVTSSKEEEQEQEPMVVVDKENALAVVAMGGGEKKKKREDVGVVKEADTRCIEQAETQIKGWLVRLEKVACDMRAVAQKKLLGDYSKTDDKLSERWFSCLPRTSGATRIAPAIDTVARDLEDLKKQYDEEFGHSTRLPLAATCTELRHEISTEAGLIGRCFLQPVDLQEWTGLTRYVWNIEGGFSSDSQQLRRLPIHSATVFTLLKRSSVDVGAESWLSLAYCAFFVFPKGKGHGVVTRDLLYQWCSLGITTRERGASCIRKLLDHSLILGEEPAWGKDTETPNASVEAATSLRMEDLMHNFARYLLGDRLIVVDGKNGATPSTSSPVNNKSSSAYLALVSNFDAKQLDISSMLPAGILALRFEGCGEMELSDGAFALFGKYLRLLDLSGYSEKKMLPDFIRHLKQLRYLKAPGIQDQVFPRPITGLHEVRYLILHGSSQLKDLTEAFQRLSNLLHLDLSRCSGLKALPVSFGRLWRLEHLDLSACSGLESLPDESFGWLRSLRHLNLADCSGLKELPKSFGMLAGLWHLDLSRCSGVQDLPKSFQYLTELRHLDLSGLSRLQALPMVSLPRELQHLNLSGCSGLAKLPDAPEPNELRYLDLSGCSVFWLPNSYDKLEKLVHLNLSGCSRLSNLPGVGWQAGALLWTTQLKHLDLSGCFLIREYLVISDLLETIRSRGGRASGTRDASLCRLGTNSTTN